MFGVGSLRDASNVDVLPRADVNAPRAFMGGGRPQV
jgi:hypothetical protein